MTDKSYTFHCKDGAMRFWDWYEVKDACEKHTGQKAQTEAEAVAMLEQHFGTKARVGYDEGIYFEGGHNED